MCYFLSFIQSKKRYHRNDWKKCINFQKNTYNNEKEVNRVQKINENVYWKKKSKIQKVYPYLTDDISADVVVIGGGIAGALTTYFLAKEGVKIAVLEKNIIGYGATSSAAATLEYQSDMDMFKLEKMIGKKEAERVYKLCLEGIDMIEEIDNAFEKQTGFKRQDSIYFTNKFMQKSNMAKEFEARKNAGFDAALLDSHTILNISSAILTKNASAIINPYMFTQGLFEYLSKMKNVKIYENTRIDSVRPMYDSVECKTNNGFKIISNSAIFTSGVDTLKYMDNANIDLYKTFTVVSKPLIDKEYLKDSSINFTARDSMDPYHYIRFDNNGRIIFGGENTKMSEKFMEEKAFRNIANDRYKRLNLSLNKLFNISDNIPLEYTFSATYANTKDSLPMIDEIPGMPNCFCNLGFGTNGIIYSALGASMLKNAINGLYTKDMNIFRINR